MGTLYVGVDLFCPGAFAPSVFRSGAETYTHDARAMFAVLQAALTTDPDTDPISPATYFSLAGPDLTAHNIVFVTEAVPVTLRGKIAASAIPVPFPPSTNLKAVWAASVGAQPIEINRSLPTTQFIAGAGSPLLLPIAEWPNFVVANFAAPPIRTYAALDLIRPQRRDGAKKDVMSWAIGLAAYLIHQHRDPNAPAPTAAERDGYALLAALDQLLGTSGTPTPLTEDAIRAHLLQSPTAGGTPRVGLLWERMLQPSLQDDPRPILAPRFTHDEESLATDPVGLLDLKDPRDPRTPIAISHHQKVWRDLGGLFASQPTDGSAAKALGRLYAFGERLRWPSRVVADPAFMVLDQNAARGAMLNWPAFGTNIHSLLGQVFRLPATLDDDISTATLALSVQGQTLTDAASALRALKGDVMVPRTWSATIGPDADRPGGFFLYAPKMAEMTQGATPTGLPTPYSVPASLLDAVDHEPRWSAPAGGPTLLVSTPPRIGLRESELYRPQLAGPAIARQLIIPARLVAMRRAAGATSDLFELVAKLTFHTTEEPEIRDRFMSIGPSGGQIWITIRTAPRIATWELRGQVLAVVSNPQRGLVATIADRSPPGAVLGDLVAQVSTTTPGGPADISLHGVAVEVMLPAGTGADPLFNRVLGGLVDPAGSHERSPLCILGGAFTSRVSVCADRVLDRFELTLSPSPIGARPTYPTVAQFGDFNKLRLALSSDAPAITARAPSGLTQGRWIGWLNYPDAIVPMSTVGYQSTKEPWLAAAPGATTGRLFGYFLSQIFTQDAKADEKGSADQRLAAESLRYLNYLTPEVPWNLEGYVEHQYSFRFPLTGPALSLPLASDLQSPANAAIRTDDRHAALMAWELGTVPPVVRIRFSRRFLHLALATDPNADDRPARFRTIYEPLAELIAAIDRGTAQLRLELWAFDPDGPHVATSKDPSPQDSGALTPNMCLVSSHVRPLHANDAPLAPLSSVRTLLAGSLSAFQTQATALSLGTGDDWLTLTIPLDGLWSNLTSPTAVFEESDVLRLGLELTRPTAAVIPGSFVDPQHPSATSGFGLAIDSDRAKTYPELKNETFSSLHDAAVVELVKYVSTTRPSLLRKRIDWIRSLRPPPPTPSAPTATDPEQTTDPRRFERLFGEATSFLLTPAGSRPAVKRVLDIYYITLGFRPLRPHPKIGDSETTLEFAEFLAQLLDDLCAGRPAQDVDVAGMPASDAWALRAALMAGVLPLMAARMGDVIATVHNVEGGLPPASLFAHVDGLARQIGSDVRAMIMGLFAQTPGLFATSKGFGLLLFEPTAWSSRLHSIQLRKQIHPADRPDGLATDPSRVDVDQFTFPRFQKGAGAQRYLIDVLDDGRYDNEFEIDQSVFNPPRPAWSPEGPGVVLDGHRLRQRGDAQARTGENIIEQQHRFDDLATGERQLEIDVIHWNPNWTLSLPGGVYRQFYLLPSRRRPASPVKLKPRPSSPAPRCDLCLKLTAPGDRPMLNDQLSALTTARLTANATAEFGTTGDTTLTAVRLATPLVGAIQPPPGHLAAPGWWHVENYASEHYFLVEADEEVGRKDGPFNNDRFRIEVELGEEPFADEDPAPPATYDVVGELGQWFKFRRLRVADPTGVPPRPAPVAREALERELRDWLAPPNPDDGLLVAAQAVSASASAAAAEVDGTITWFAPGKPAASRLCSNSAQGVGSVVAVEVMQLKTDRPSTDRFVLKVMVLDEPWRYTRVRLRTERNFRDVNDDDIPDINPVFQMVGNFSTWSSHGRESTNLNFRVRQAEHFPSVLVTMTPAISLADFFDADPPQGYGDQLGASIDAAFTDATGAVQTFWNRDRARSSRYALSGLVVQRRFDLHPRHSGVELTDQLETRTEEVPRLHLRSLPASTVVPPPPRDFAPLLEGVDRTRVPSPHHDVRVVWANARGEAVVTATWPIRFRA